MAVKKIEELNIHRDVNSTEQFDVQGYLNENWDKMQDVVDNNAEELMQVQKDISTLKEDNKTNKSSIDVLEKSNETRDKKISKNAEDIEAIQESIKTATETINKKDNAQDDSIMAIQENIETINSKNEEQDSAISDNATSIKNLQAKNVEINAENERLREDIKSIALPGEASGENIHLEDSSDARCKIEIGGNHKQETRSGKNRINLELLGSGTLNGVTYNYNKENQSITFNGTCTKDNTRFIINDDANIQTIAKKTTFTAQYLSGSVSNYFTARIADNEWKHNLLLSLLTLNSSNNKVSLTETEDMVGVHIDIKANNGTTFNNFTIQLMLTDEVDTEYEMYGASPSINYPSFIKAVGNIKNILDMRNAKGGTSGGITCNMIADGSYTYKGTASSKAINIWLLGSYNNKTPIFRLEPGTYYIDGVVLFDGNNVLANPDTAKIFTFINAHDITGVRALDAVLKNTYDETKYPIIAKIDHEIPWVPYDCGYAKVNIQNKNIAPIFNLGTNWKYTDKGIKNTITSAEKEITKFKLKAGQTIKIGFKLFSKPSQDTTFTWYVNNVSNIISSFGHIDRTTFELNKIYTRTYTAKEECVIRSKMFGNANNDIFEFQMWAEYDNLTEYKKYEEQSYLVDVQQPMLEGDKFVKIDAKWYEKHNWKTMSFDGKNMGSQAGGTFADFKENGNIVRTFEIKDLLISSVRNDIFCDKLPKQADSMWNGKSTGIQSWQGQNKILISLPFDDVEKKYGQKLTVDNYVTAFYMYLQDEVLIISYPLAEPKLLECTETQSKELDEIYNKIHTYKNITNILAESAEVNPIVSLKYLKDAETEHNKLQTQIDEIKQLLSTTETSAMLLNNMQTDLESEV